MSQSKNHLKIVNWNLEIKSLKYQRIKLCRKKRAQIKHLIIRKIYHKMKVKVEQYHKIIVNQNQDQDLKIK